MTTNYYLIQNPCLHCGRGDKRLHIGLSAYGWRFLFQYIEGIAENIEQWQQLTKQGYIEDEYDNKIEYNDFWDLVETKQANKRFLEGVTQSERIHLSKFREIGEYDFDGADFS